MCFLSVLSFSQGCLSRNVTTAWFCSAFPSLFLPHVSLILSFCRFKEAEKDCDIALSLDPQYSKTWARRGAARKALGLLALAVEDFQQVLRLEPKNCEANAALVELKKVRVGNNLHLL